MENTSIDFDRDFDRNKIHQFNTQNSLAFLYTNNEKTEREIKETIPFTIATKKSLNFSIYYNP